MSDWEGDEFEEIGGGETEPTPTHNQPEEVEEPVQPLEEQVALHDHLAEESVIEQTVEEPTVVVAPVVSAPQSPVTPLQRKQPVKVRPVAKPVVSELEVEESEARAPQPPPAAPLQRKQPVLARPAVKLVEEPEVKEPVVVEDPVVQEPEVPEVDASPVQVKRIVSVDGPSGDQSVREDTHVGEDAVSESSYVVAASIATPRTPSVDMMPTQDEKSLLERLDAICTLLNQPVGGGVQMGSMADLSGHAIRNVPMRHSPLTALDAQQRFTTPRLHYAHQLDCFYHHVFLEAPGPNMTGLGDHLQRLYDEKRANIPLLLSEFLGSEENLFRLLLLKYNRPSYARFVHFND